MDTLTLTPNIRLAQYLQKEFAAQAMESVSTTPQILPLDSWLQELYQGIILHQPDLPRLLTPNQEYQLWQELVLADDTTLLQPRQTAKLLQQTYRIVQQWHLSLNDIPHDGNEDTTFFITLAQQFEQYCAQHNLLSCSRLINVLSTPTLALPRSASLNSYAEQRGGQEIILYEFDELTPQQEHFFAQLQTLGFVIKKQIQIIKFEDSVETLSSQDHSGSHFFRITCDTQADELLTMARWAKALHQQNAQQHITCVIPNLTQLRQDIINVFTEVFTPDHFFNPNQVQTIFNVSGGTPLAQAPIIHVGLLLLQQHGHSIDYQSLTLLLMSPFINGWHTEQFARAQCDATLRDLNVPTLSWSLIINTIKQDCAESCPQLIIQLENYVASTLTTKKQYLKNWADDFIDLLNTVGWPGERTLSSIEYQQVQRWYELLVEFANLDTTAKKYTYRQAVQLVQQLTQETLFAPESADCPIQVLGLLEAAGTSADALWLMGLDDQIFPAVANPSPFLPYYWQRQHNMPHSSAQRELDYAKRLLNHFVHSAPLLICSYHQYDGDRHLTMSPLLTDIPELPLTQLAVANYQPIAEQIFAHRQLETIEDTHGPALTTQELIHGGTGILKSQANCPFQAFARYRLNAETVNEPELGLNYLERGLLLHQILEHLWNQLGSSATLVSYAAAQLTELVTNTITAVFKKFRQHYPEKLSANLQELETIRLTEIILDWLRLEQQRPGFTVLAQEQQQTTTIGPLTLRIKMDRIDQLENGATLVIDYKTGKVSPKDWLGERPSEPQLPLYALTQPNMVALAFAQLKVGELAWVGLSAEETEIAGITPLQDYKPRGYEQPLPETWHALLTEWRTALSQLATEFSQGVAVVNPKDINKTCGQCDLQTLCRIHEHVN